MALLFGAPLVSGLLRHAPPRVPVLGTLTAFTLETVDGEAVDSTSLAGQAWVGAFFSPACPGCVAGATTALERLQRRTRNAGPGLRILAVSLDPDTSMAWLHGESESHRANPRVWRFTRGPDAPRLEAAAAAMAGPATAVGLSQGAQLVLVDGRSRVRGFYPSDERALDRLVGDIALILNEGR